MNWLVFGGSLAAILMLSGSARLLRLGAASPLDEATAREEAEQGLPGFHATEAIVSASGRAALVASPDGVALVRAHGAHHVVRLLTAPKVRVDAGSLIVDSGERIFGPTTLELGEAAREWATRLGHT